MRHLLFDIQKSTLEVLLYKTKLKLNNLKKKQTSEDNHLIEKYFILF